MLIWKESLHLLSSLFTLDNAKHMHTFLYSTRGGPQNLRQAFSTGSGPRTFWNSHAYAAHHGKGCTKAVQPYMPIMNNNLQPTSSLNRLYSTKHMPLLYPPLRASK